MVRIQREESHPEVKAFRVSALPVLPLPRAGVSSLLLTVTAGHGDTALCPCTMWSMGVGVLVSSGRPSRPVTDGPGVWGLWTTAVSV